jgi:hypothetical protein
MATAETMTDKTAATGEGEFVAAIPKLGSGTRQDAHAERIVEKAKARPGAILRVANVRGTALRAHLKAMGAKVEARQVAKVLVERANGEGTRMAPVYDLYVVWPK